MKSRIATLFTHHPETVGESYGEHFGVALRYSGRLALASGAALVHAFLPFLFEKMASTAIKAMHADIVRRSASGDVSGARDILAR